MSFVRATERKAIKEHACDELGCDRGNPIKPGQRYVVLFGVFDGEPWTAKLCLRCNRAHQRVFKRFGVHDEDGPGIGNLLDWLRDRPESKRERAKRLARYDVLRAEAEARVAARRLTAISRVAGAVAAVARSREAALVVLERAIPAAVKRGGYDEVKAAICTALASWALGRDP